MLTSICGINWGDEGKGRMVDLLSRDFDIVCRYQGGNNAGHTVINEKGKFILNLLPSGILREDVVKAIALGADACYIATAAVLALGCHLCRSCHAGKCNWGIATQRPDLVKRLNPDIGKERLVNLVHAWTHEIQEMMGGMGINSIEALRGNRLMLRGVGLNETELRILGIKHAGE